jgi:hypothetical protein
MAQTPKNHQKAGPRACFFYARLSSQPTFSAFSKCFIYNDIYPLLGMLISL